MAFDGVGRPVDVRQVEVTSNPDGAVRKLCCATDLMESTEVGCIFTVVVSRPVSTNDNEGMVDCCLNFNTYHFTVSVNWYFLSYNSSLYCHKHSSITVRSILSKRGFISRGHEFARVDRRFKPCVCAN